MGSHRLVMMTLVLVSTMLRVSNQPGHVYVCDLECDGANRETCSNGFAVMSVAPSQQ